ncbi:MAG: thioesterase family protein [Polyangiales bacterium]
MGEPHIHTMRIRFRDTDAQGHVYFANYLVFCDEAWGAYTRHIGMPYQDLVKLGIDTFYVSAQCEYLGSAVYEDEIHIETHVTRIGTSSVTLSFEIRDDARKTLAKATVTCVCVDPETRKTARVPDELRVLIAEFEGTQVNAAS